MFDLASLALLLALSSAGPVPVSVLGPPPGEVLKKSDQQELSRLMDDYFEAHTKGKGLAEARVKLEEKIEKLEKASKNGPAVLSLTDDLERALYLAKVAGYGYKDDVKKGDVVELAPKDSTQRTTVWVPKTYKVSSGPYPLILAIADAGQRASELLERELAAPELREGTIIAVVQMPEDPSAWSTTDVRAESSGAKSVLLTLKDLRRGYAVDLDRVHLVGHGAGAAAAMTVAAMFPYDFAGVVTRASDIPASIDAANFLNLPTLFCGGGAHCTAFEEQAKSLGISNVTIKPDGDAAAIAAWMADKRRDMSPPRVVIQPVGPDARTSYWVEVDGLEGGARCEARVDRATNSVLIEARAVAFVSLYLNDALLDLGRTVRVVINGAEQEFRPARNLETLLNFVIASGDWGRVFTLAQRFDVPSPATGAGG
jgi:pimeloyl-ACP methyl ester carboxylesterase